MKCESVKDQLLLHLYGELGFDEEEAVEDHLESCAACLQELNTLKALHRLADSAELVPPAGLAEACRADLMDRVRSEAPSGRPGWWRRIWSWTPVAVAWKPAAALTLVAAGFFGARLSGPGTVRVPTLAGGSGPVTSRVRFVEPEADGRVQIVLDETRRRVMTGRLTDEPIRRMLLVAAADREDPGLRVESLDILKSYSESAEIRNALMAALRSDPDAGVRLKALEGLKSFATDSETRKAVAHVLLNDDNASVRTMAVNLLVERTQQGDAGVLQQSLRSENNDYIRERSARALREMRASVETF